MRSPVVQYPGLMEPVYVGTAETPFDWVSPDTAMVNRRPSSGGVTVSETLGPSKVLLDWIPEATDLVLPKRSGAQSGTTVGPALASKIRLDWLPQTTEPGRDAPAVPESTFFVGDFDLPVYDPAGLEWMPKLDVPSRRAAAPVQVPTAFVEDFEAAPLDPLDWLSSTTPPQGRAGLRGGGMLLVEPPLELLAPLEWLQLYPDTVPGARPLPLATGLTLVEDFTPPPVVPVDWWSPQITEPVFMRGRFIPEAVFFWPDADGLGSTERGIAPLLRRAFNAGLRHVGETVTYYSGGLSGTARSIKVQVERANQDDRDGWMHSGLVEFWVANDATAGIASPQEKDVIRFAPIVGGANQDCVVTKIFGDSNEGVWHLGGRLV